MPVPRDLKRLPYRGFVGVLAEALCDLFRVQGLWFPERVFVSFDSQMADGLHERDGRVYACTVINAFPAIHLSHAMELLDRNTVAGILAHEVGHAARSKPGGRPTTPGGIEHGADRAVAAIHVPVLYRGEQQLQFLTDETLDYIHQALRDYISNLNWRMLVDEDVREDVFCSRALSPTIHTLPMYQGAAWRSESGYLHAKDATAADVVRFERDDLGNDWPHHLAPGLLRELEHLPARESLWVARTKAGARMYGDEPAKVLLSQTARVAHEEPDGVFVLNV